MFNEEQLHNKGNIMLNDSSCHQQRYDGMKEWFKRMVIIMCRDP